MKDPIAIVGAACQYPDARSPAELWENAVAGRRAFRRLPDCRLRRADYVSDDPTQPDMTYSGQAAVIKDYEFDRAHYRVVGTTFRSADMTHWLALDVAARALADAGFPDGEGLPKDEVGVLVGNSLTGEFSRAGVLRLRWPYVRRTVDAALTERDWPAHERREFLDALETQYKSPFPPVGDETLAGGLSNTIAGRICNYFDLRGGGYTVDGACASSLLATANACSALSAGDIDVALAGGVDLSLDPFELIGFAKVGALARGDMRVFDARSAGFWPGEGCGMVVLMRASDAIAQGRRIYAVIRGWGISSDGHGGITRPEVEGQKLALARAYRRAEFSIDTIAYFEGHGTGTTVGDAAEIKALLDARAKQIPGRTRAALGSVKASIGHTKAAAGVAGLIKAAMAVHHQLIPPSVGWQQPHPRLESDDASLELLRHAKPWPQDLPLRAAVSAMGFGGINAHLVLEAPTSLRRPTLAPHEKRLISSIQDAELFLVGGSTHAEVEQKIRTLASYAVQLSFAEMADLAAELASKLDDAPVRAALVASRPNELQQALDKLLGWLADGVESRLDFDAGVMLATGEERPAIGFLFPGQGSAASLTGGAWRVRFPLVEEIYARADLPTAANAVATEVAHPAIMTSSLAGLAMMNSLGIEATVGIGHSLGELAAYRWAGAFDDDALARVASARGRALAVHGQPGGSMASIAAPQATVEPLLAGLPVVIAGINSPKQTVVSGEAAAIERVVERARSAELGAVHLPVSHAFHSPMVADAAPALAAALDREDIHPPERLVVSTITGGFLDDSENLRELLLRQLTSPVRLMEAVEAAAIKVDLWIEVGPGHVMAGIVRSLVDAPVVSLDAGGDSLRELLRAVGAAFVMGAPVQHAALFEGRFTRPFDLDWQPRFFVNPCELAPLPADELPLAAFQRSAVTPAEEQAVPTPPPSVDPAAPQLTALEVVRQLVAERAELPPSAVQDDHRLLQDLHFTSIAVGSLVAEAARSLGLPPPVSPTDYAHATVGAVATALDELAKSGGADAHSADALPAGVDAWTRAFTVELVEESLTDRGGKAGSGHWTLVAPPEHPFADALQRALTERVAGRGVVVCLPPDADEKHLPLLIRGAQVALENPRDCRFVLVQHGPGGGGWARTLHLETPQVTTCILEIPAGHLQAIDWIVAEAAAAHGFVEANYDSHGVRRVPMLRLLPLTDGDTPPLGPVDVLLVTGGGKGIAAESALALATKYGVRLALLGRSARGDEQLEENLRRMEASGAVVRYLPVDITEAAAVRTAVETIERELGPITAILHGAGVNVPRSIGAIDEAAARATLQPKVDGLRNVLAAVDPERLRLLVAFGSIIARSGMHGEADYALANEWLTRLVDRWHRDHPHCRALCVEWSVWSGVGMGERLGRIDALRQQGITPITPDEGVRLLGQLIAAPLPVTSVVVGGRFGNPPTLRVEQPELPLLRFLENPRVHFPGIELVVDVALSLGTDPYLRDHTYQDTPLLPAVVGLEAMAQVCSALTGSAAPPVFENVELSRPITVPESGSRTIRSAALVRAPGRIEIVLRSDETGFQADHFRATCRFDRLDDLLNEPLDPLFEVNDTEPSLPINPEQDLYGQILFHRGWFRRVHGYRQLSATRCIAELTPEGRSRWFTGYLPERLLLGDPAVRDATIHAIQACIPHGTILPVGIDRLIPNVSVHAEPLFVHAREREHTGDRFVYDVDVATADGRVCERWEGLRLQRVGEPALLGHWIEPLLGPYFERRLAELLPGTAATLAVKSNGCDGEHDSDGAIFAALGNAVPIHRRSDGKPIALCDREVSVAHAGTLTMSIAGRGPVACDAEPVLPRTSREWHDLLGKDRTVLAEWIAGQSSDDFGAAASRLWSAGECLKKAGLPTDSPLTVRATTPDGWIVLAAGTSSIATWIGPVGESAQPLAVAMLVGSADAKL